MNNIFSQIVYAGIQMIISVLMITIILTSITIFVTTIPHLHFHLVLTYFTSKGENKLTKKQNFFC